LEYNSPQGLDNKLSHHLYPSFKLAIFWTSSAAASNGEGATAAAGASGGQLGLVLAHQSPTMGELPHTPSLSPQFCFSSASLRGMFAYLEPHYEARINSADYHSDFLRLSRSVVDDTITENINALVTPSRDGFDPSSTSQRAHASGSRYISPQACQSFKTKVLFPSWQARTEVLKYCALVAAGPDPDDPEATLRDAEMQKDHERVVDERLDPYSGRFSPREARTQVLASLVRQERGIEEIVRNRSWAVLQERCSSSPHETWQEAMRKDGFNAASKLL
jgi:hypothetical protein